jgi:hypothetical protein
VPGGSINANSFDRSCTSDDDCVLVWEGPVCQCGRPASVNESAEDEFEDRKEELQEKCRGEVESCEAGSRPENTQCLDGRCTYVSNP